MTLPIFALILANVLLTSLAQISLKAGMTSESVSRAIADSSGLLLIRAVVSQPLVLVGLGMYVASAALWLAILARVEVSLAYPFVGLGFVVTMLLGWILLGDDLNSARVLGTLLIVAGVVMLAHKG